MLFLHIFYRLLKNGRGRGKCRMLASFPLLYEACQKGILRGTAAPAPSWTGSFLKALRRRQDSSCLFLQHSPVTRRNLEWPPITASRHVVFAHFVSSFEEWTGQREMSNASLFSPLVWSLPKGILRGTATTVPSWTDSFLKTLRSRQDRSCHLFLQQSPVTRKKLRMTAYHGIKACCFCTFCIVFWRMDGPEGNVESPFVWRLPKGNFKWTATPVPSWTDSFLKTLRSRQDSSCHLVLQQSPVTRKNLEWPPVTASRHVVFAHFVSSFEEWTGQREMSNPLLYEGCQKEISNERQRQYPVGQIRFSKLCVAGRTAVVISFCNDPLWQEGT